MRSVEPAEPFRTRDYWLAAALLASGRKLDGLDWHDGRAYFVFQDLAGCEQTAEAYWRGDLRVAVSISRYPAAQSPDSNGTWKKKRDGGVVHFPPFSFEFLAELHILIKKEMQRRCFRHLITDELDAHSSFLEQQRRTVAVDFAGRIEGIPRG